MRLGPGVLMKLVFPCMQVTQVFGLVHDAHAADCDRGNTRNVTDTD